MDIQPNYKVWWDEENNMQLTYYKKPKLPPQYTEAFRDPEVWEAVRKVVDSSLSAGRDNKSSMLRVFRAWSAGCATGEEAYSLTSILQDSFSGKRIYWKVYATDIKTKLKFSHNNIRFKQHDLVADPPLTYMNLIFCRNVLMFFKKEYQEIICKNLYNSLRIGGYLVLGKAEQLRGEVDGKFRIVDNKLRIYQKQ